MCLIGLTFSCTEDLPQDTSFLTSISKKRANITDSLYIDLHSDIASLGETIEPDVSYPKKLANATYYIIGNLGTPPSFSRVNIAPCVHVKVPYLFVYSGGVPKFPMI